MTVKKKYNVGDTVWIYGISRNNERSTQGTVLKSFVIDYNGFNNELHYVIGIPTEIEMLLEIRTWHTISQTKDGHVGSLRDAFENPDAAHRMLAKTGMAIISSDGEYTGDSHNGMESTLDDDDPSSDEIHAALEKSQKDSSHGPLIIKDIKPKRKYYGSRKKKA
jgi:hypothetical protein